MEKARCSYCGKETVSIKEREMELSEPYGGTSTVTIQVKACTHCGFEEDGDGNDLVVQKELAVLRRTSMVKVLDALNAMGHTNAAMERALGLPARTLARWKNEQSMSPSASGIALMRIIRTYPWILAVAEMGFDQKAARDMLLGSAVNELVKLRCEHPEWELTTSARVSENHLEVFITGSRNVVTEAVTGAYATFALLR